MLLTLTQDEAEFLLAALKKTLGELRQEVYHAEVSGFKDQLKDEEETIRSLMLKLEQAA